MRVHEDIGGVVRRLWRRPDFRQNPIQALRRRLVWHARWACTNKPWRLPLSDGGSILAARSGAGALIYYLGASEPEVFSFLTSFLKPGMVFWDVGAHIGEYSLLASKRVGEHGRVESFEPHPHLIEFLSHNINSSKFMNVVLHQQAITNHVGVAELVLEPEPSLSYLEPVRLGEGVSPRVTVPTLSLDRFHQLSGYTPHLVKVDVEGVEHLVIEGATSLLRLPPDTAPVWIMEFASQNCARYGYHPNHLLSEFRKQGYRTFWLTSTGMVDARPAVAADNVTRNFVATKNESLLETLTHIVGAA